MTELLINSSNNEMNNKEENENKRTTILIDDDNLFLSKSKKQESISTERTNKTEDKNNEINYNPNLFMSLSINKNKNAILSKNDKILLEYNKIKENFNKIVATFDNTKSKSFKNKEKYIKKLSEFNITLLNYFSELSNLLNKILENPKLYSNKKFLTSSVETIPKSRINFTNNNNSQNILDNSEKIITLYEKQYNKITERLKKIKSDEYINNLKSNISNINEEINKYEKENIELKKNQIIFENSIKNKASGKSSESMDNNIQKKLDICKKIQYEFIKTSKKIENNKEEIQNNSEKINILNQKCQDLKKMAKDMYDIEQFETIEKIKQKSKEKKEKIQRKIREYEINIHSMQAGLNKLLMKYQENKKQIEIIEEEKNILIEKYKEKEHELELVNNKIKDYKNIHINGISNPYKENETINKRNIHNNLKKKELVIKTEESLKDELIRDNKNQRYKRNQKDLISSGPSLISLTKEKSNFGDINDIQLLNPQKDDNSVANNKNENQINKDIINIKNQEENNEQYNSKIKTNLNNREDKKEKEKEKEIIDKQLKNKNANTLSKEMILKGLDKQEKEDNALIYSSRNIQNKNNKGGFDRRNFLKLNFSFVTPSKDNRLNRSLNTLPNERNLLDYEIEENIVLDSNSANNINANERKFNTKIEDIHISQDNSNNLKNNNSIEIDKKLVNNENIENNEISNYEKESNAKREENYEKDNDKRENALNTILYNVGDKTKNEKFLDSIKNENGNNNLNNEEEQINKSFEEEHIFEKQNQKEEKKEDKDEKEKEKEETDSVNYGFDDGDNIIDVDYDKI